MIDFAENIDDYLDGLLSKENQIVFQKELESNSKLGDEVNLQKEVRSGIEAYGISQFVHTTRTVEDELDQEGFFADTDEKELLGSIEKLASSEFANLVSDVDQEMEKESFYEKTESTHQVTTAKIKPLQTSRRRTLAIAASLIVLIGAAISLWPSGENPTAIYDQHFAAAPDLVSQDVLSEKSEVGFAGDNTALILLEDAMKLYENKSYAAFVQKMAPLLNEKAIGHYKDRMQMYQGIGYLELGDFKNAILSLEASRMPLAKDYLMLAYIVNGESSKAKGFFENQSNPSETLKKIYRRLD